MDKINILVIDDNPIEHTIMQRMFDKFQLFPKASHSLDARLSMDIFEQHYSTLDLIPDVVFLDLNMPDFSGWNFLESFENVYKKIKKPVDIYILTSSIDNKDKRLPDQYPFVKACITKPIKMDTLLNLHSLYHSSKAAS
ncbi:response regulator [Mucilaginibacter xinganensis]|uniref:CheY chemotaxis protein or a CheY-like REC (Receiver) domain n=1 Tax=Mucilaginibacter xinganensis TaxID=1234841 RepID=A0A223P3U3_9SPHI|nr:response regulator [Mucilaginibacter xinganensis]ASU36491.1 CheY chemotaxis protein or a CheY-like REC (receiver) domain [Mucilaginibacter xinganensis]